MLGRSDEDLVTQCLEGDKGSFDILVKRYEETMFRTAYNIVKDVEAARDVTQNGFVKSWEKLDSYDPKYKFFSWLYRIIVNEALNNIRDQRNFEKLPTDRSHGKTPYRQIVKKEEDKKLYRAIDSLSDDYRVVIYLRHFDGLSYREMAEVLEIEEKTVKSRLYSARLKLREILLER